MTIVLADNDTAVRERLRKRLGKISGVSVAGESSTSSEATAMILNRNPDVAIVSSCLDGGSGLDVLQHIRQLMVPPTIIVMLDQASQGDKHAYSTAGADFVLEKVPDDGSLLNTIRLLCFSHRKIDALDASLAASDD